MTRAYWEFLVHGEQLQAPIPSTKEVQRVTQTCRTGERHVGSFSVARVRPRTSKGITDLLLLNLAWLNATCPSKKLARSGANRRRRDERRTPEGERRRPGRRGRLRREPRTI